MKIAKKEINSLCAILIIIMLMISDLLLIGSEAVSYALDMVKTNNKNVSFVAYFMDENENKVQRLEKSMLSEEYIYVDITVEKEGYFDGDIYVEDGNFNLSQEVVSENVEKIEGNEVTLNQISAESTVTVKLKVEPVTDDIITQDLLDADTHVSLKGEYVNSKNVEKGKYIEIDSTSDVRIHWVSEEELKANLESKVITNSIITRNGEEKRLVQVAIRSSLDKNSYPLKNSKLKMEMGELNVEEITAYAKNTSNTNSNLNFGKENYIYNTEEKSLEINLDNLDTNLISWNKEASDVIIASLILNKDEEINEKEINISSELTTYDGKIVNGECVAIINEEIDGIVSGEITNSEEDIYKGNIYSKEPREYKTETKIDVNFENLVQSLEINESKSEFVVEDGTWTAEIIYKNMMFNKLDLEKILGEKGSITITVNDGQEILNKSANELEADENGNIILNFEEEVNTIKIFLSKLQEQGTLTFEYTKQINNNTYDRGQVKQIIGINNNTQVKSIYENGENLINSQNRINLLETTSQADLSLNQETIASQTNGTELTIMATLKQNEETQDLYLNPKLKIELPETITKIKEAKYKLLHKENFEVSKANIIEEDGKQKIKIELKGEQTKYYADGIDGLDIVIYTTLDVAEIEEPKEELVTLYFENENRTGETYKTEENITIMPKINEDIQELSQEEIDNAKSLEEGQLETLIYAKKGDKVLKDTDTVYEGETVTYYIKLTNKGQNSIRDLEVIGKTQNAMYYDLIEEDVTYANGDTNPDNILKFHKYGEADLEEKKFDKIEELKSGESIILSYKVVANKTIDNDDTLKTTITINRTAEETESQGQTVEFGAYKIEKAEAKMNISYSLYEEEEIYSREGAMIEVHLKNISENKLENLKIHLKWSEGLSITDEQLDKIIYKTKLKNPDESEDEITLDDAIYGEYSVLENGENSLILNVPVIQKSDEVYIVLYFSTDEFDRNLTERKVSLVGDVTVGENNYSSNKLEKIVNQELTTLEVTQSSNIPEDTILVNNDNLIYTFNIVNTGSMETKVSLTDIMEQGTNINKAYYIKNGEQKELEKLKFGNDDFKVNEENSDGPIITPDIPDGYINDSKINLLLDLNPSEEAQLVIDTTINQELVLEQKLSNYAEIVFNYTEEMKSNVIVHKVAERIQDKKPDPDDSNDGNNNGNTDLNGSNGENNDSEKTKTYGISGICYLDKNKNGKLEDTEKLLSGIEAQLLNIKTNSFVKASSGKNLIITTNDKGEYKFENIPEGSYIVVFNYDTGVYEPTKYEADGVMDSRNSNAIEKNMEVDGISKKRAVTDNIELTQNRDNINLGLVEKDIYDLSLTKTVSKVTIINSHGTETNTYNSNLAKAEIHAKYLEGSTAIVEYKIDVTNEGEVAGYAKSIVDYKPSDLNFDSKLNKDWYQSGDSLYNTSIAKTIIAPGETKSLTLVLTKTMTESNVGLINNQAEIAEDSNGLGISDRDSIPGNKQKGEDDLETANLIISVKTGAAVGYISFTLSIFGFLIAIAYLINIKIIKEHIKF